MNDLTGKCLLATPQLANSNFKEAVIFIVEDNTDGAMGIVINKISDCQTKDFFKSLKLKVSSLKSDKKKPTLIHCGGPVQQEHGFIIHSNDAPEKWQTTIHQGSNVSVTVSKDIMKSIANGTGPKDHFISLGCSGWEPGQLQEEINDNLWLLAPFDPEITFNTPIKSRYQKTAQSIGIKTISLLTPEVGHA
jgi:putative transcriptional regulator